MILQMARLPVNAVVFAAMAALVAGCGNSNPASTSAHAGITKAQVVAYADAVNLRAADVPEMTSVSPTGETKASQSNTTLTRCRGGLPGWEAGSVFSAKFHIESPSRTEAVWSAIRVVPSPTVAVQDLSADRNPRVGACIARSFGAILTQSGPLVRESMSVSLLPSELPGVASGFGLRLTRRVIYREANPRPPEHNLAEKLAQLKGGVHPYWDMVGFASGRVEIALADLHEPGVAPMRFERRLLLLLHSRSEAHKL